MEIINLAIALIIFLFLSGFFSCVEMAYISFDKLLLGTQAKKRRRYAERMRRILADPSRFITFVLIGNNICLVGLSSVGTLLAERLIGSENEGLIELAVVLCMTPVIVIFAELLPKNLGYLHSTRVCIRSSLTVDFLMRLLFWPIQFFQWLSGVLTLPFRPLFKASSGALSRGEIRHLFEEGLEQGGQLTHKKELIDYVFDFNRILVRQKMVPLARVAKVRVDETPEKLRELARKTHFSRFVVYGKNAKDILGFVNIYDVLFDENKNVSIQDHLRTPLFVKEETTLQQALEKLRREREWFLFVIGRQEQIVGTLTLKRLLNF